MLRTSRFPSGLVPLVALVLALCCGAPAALSVAASVSFQSTTSPYGDGIVTLDGDGASAARCGYGATVQLGVSGNLYASCSGNPTSYALTHLFTRTPQGVITNTQEMCFDQGLVVDEPSGVKDTQQLLQATEKGKNVFGACSGSVTVYKTDGTSMEVVAKADCSGVSNLRYDSITRSVLASCISGTIYRIDPDTLDATDLLTSSRCTQTNSVRSAVDGRNGTVYYLCGFFMMSVDSVGSVTQLTGYETQCYNTYDFGMDHSHQLLYMSCAYEDQYILQYDLRTSTFQHWGALSALNPTYFVVDETTGDILTFLSNLGSVVRLRYSDPTVEIVTISDNCLSPPAFAFSADGSHALVVCAGGYWAPSRLASFPIPIQAPAVQLCDTCVIRSSPNSAAGIVTPVNVQLTASEPVPVDVQVQLSCDHSLPTVVFDFKAGDTQVYGDILPLNDLSDTIQCSYSFGTENSTDVFVLPSPFKFTARPATGPGSASLLLTGQPADQTVIEPKGTISGMTLASATSISGVGLTADLECTGDNGYSLQVASIFTFAPYASAGNVSQVPSVISLDAPAQLVTCTVTVAAGSDPDFLAPSPVTFQFILQFAGLAMTYAHDAQVSGALVPLTLSAVPPTVPFGSSFHGELVCTDGAAMQRIAFAINDTTSTDTQSAQLLLGGAAHTVTCLFDTATTIGTGIFASVADDLTLLPPATISVLAASAMVSVASPYGSSNRLITTQAISDDQCQYSWTIYLHPTTGELVHACTQTFSDHRLAILYDHGTVSQVIGTSTCVQGNAALVDAAGSVYSACASAPESTSAVVKIFTNGTVTEVMPRSSCIAGYGQAVALDEATGDIYVGCAFDNVYKLEGGTGTPIPLFDESVGKCTNIVALRFDPDAKMLLVACLDTGGWAFPGGVQTHITDSSCSANDVAYDASQQKAYIACSTVASYDFIKQAMVPAELDYSLCQTVYGLTAKQGHLFADCGWTFNNNQPGIIARFGDVGTAPVFVYNCFARSLAYNPTISTLYAACYQGGVQAFTLLPATVALSANATVSSSTTVEEGIAVSVELTASPAVTVDTSVTLSCDNGLSPIEFAFVAADRDRSHSAVTLLPLTGFNAIVACTWAFSNDANAAGAVLPEAMRFVARDPNTIGSLSLSGVPADLEVVTGVQGLQLVLPAVPIGNEGLRVEMACVGDHGFNLAATAFAVSPMTMGGFNASQVEPIFPFLASAQTVTCTFSVASGSDPAWPAGTAVGTFRVIISGVAINADVLVKAGRAAQLTVSALPTMQAGDSFSGTLRCTSQPDTNGQTDISSNVDTAIALDHTRNTQLVQIPTALSFDEHTFECSFVAGSLSGTGFLAGISLERLPSVTVGVTATIRVTSSLTNGTILDTLATPRFFTLTATPVPIDPVAIFLTCNHNVAQLRFLLDSHNPSVSQRLDLELLDVSSATVTCTYAFDPSIQSSGVVLPAPVRFTARPADTSEFRLVVNTPTESTLIDTGKSFNSVTLTPNVAINSLGVRLLAQCYGSSGFYTLLKGLFVVPAYSAANEPCPQAYPIKFLIASQSVTCELYVENGSDEAFNGQYVGSFVFEQGGVQRQPISGDVPSGSVLPLTVLAHLTSVPAGSSIQVRLNCTDSATQDMQSFTFMLDSMHQSQTKNYTTALGPEARPVECKWDLPPTVATGIFSIIDGSMLPEDFTFYVHATVALVNPAVAAGQGHSVLSPIGDSTLGEISSMTYDPMTRTSYLSSGALEQVVAVNATGSIRPLLYIGDCNVDSRMLLASNTLYALCHGGDDNAAVIAINVLDATRRTLVSMSQCASGQGLVLDSRGFLWLACFNSGVMSIAPNGTVTLVVDNEVCPSPLDVAFNPTTGSVLAACSASSSLLSIKLSTGAVTTVFDESQGCTPKRLKFDVGTGSTLVMCSGDNLIVRVTPHNTAVTPVFPSYLCGRPQDMELASDGSVIVSCQRSGIIAVRNTTFVQLATTAACPWPSLLLANGTGVAAICDTGAQLFSPNPQYFSLTAGGNILSLPASLTSGPAVSVKLASTAQADPFTVVLRCDSGLPPVFIQLQPLPGKGEDNGDASLVAGTTDPHKVFVSLPLPEVLTVVQPESQWSMEGTGVLPLNGLNAAVNCVWQFEGDAVPGVILPPPVHFMSISSTPRLTVGNGPINGASLALHAYLQGMTLRSNQSTSGAGIIVSATCTGTRGFSTTVDPLFTIPPNSVANMEVAQSRAIPLPSVAQAVTCNFVIDSHSDLEVKRATIEPLRVVAGVLSAGDFCFFTTNCASPLRCNSLTSHCAAGATVGNSCGVSGDCATGSSCVNGVCVAPPTLPQPPALPPSPYQQAISVTMSLILSIEATAITPALKTAIIADLLIALQITLARLSGFTLVPGSVVASFTVLPSSDPTEPTPTAVLNSLHTQLADPTSTLLSLNTTQYTQELTGVTYAAVAQCANGSFQQDCSQAGGYQLLASSPSGDSGLSSQAKAGIIAACVIVGVLLLIASAYFLYVHHGQRRGEKTTNHKLPAGSVADTELAVNIAPVPSNSDANSAQPSGPRVAHHANAASIVKVHIDVPRE